MRSFGKCWFLLWVNVTWSTFARSIQWYGKGESRNFLKVCYPSDNQGGNHLLKWNRAVRNPFLFLCLLLFLVLSLAGCGGSGSSPTTTPTVTGMVNPPPKNPFKVTEVKMS